MAGGAVFVFVLLVLSTIIASIWLFKGRGSRSCKVVQIALYFSCTLLPAIVIVILQDSAEHNVILSNISFILFCCASVYGFVLPIFSGYKNERVKSERT
ncbi:hypothetical protein OPS25_10775 [Alteromonas ponticola]|uniref:Uncharacterized protein n=1 Tax=Alteromonas aquimaris TaxID=2998417 RepID=A0ABT3P893_9ALTE|nr:hypothetical protein [Alteromonas aquimaris]MCW8108977.1 hypothetical protein [Alteromonas aquimaris]